MELGDNSSFFLVTMMTLSLLIRPSFQDHNEASNRSSEKGESSDLIIPGDLAMYVSACDRLRGMANWMSTALRIKSSISKSATERKQARLISSRSGNLPNQQQELKRPAINHGNRLHSKSDEDPCSSMKNLFSSARSYVQWQMELMRATALLGGDAVRTRVSKLNDNSAVLKRIGGIIPPVNITNRTSAEILESLKVATRALGVSLDQQRKRAVALIREASRTRDFLGYLSGIREKMALRLNHLGVTNENLHKTKSILHSEEDSAIDIDNHIPEEDMTRQSEVSRTD